MDDVGDRRHGDQVPTAEASDLAFEAVLRVRSRLPERHELVEVVMRTAAGEGGSSSDGRTNRLPHRHPVHTMTIDRIEASSTRVCFLS
jgi:hypothetical protein